jgi:hypothetical protein
MVEHHVRGALVFNLSLHTTRVRLCPEYSVCKPRCECLSTSSRRLGPYGISVNAVSPGAFRHVVGSSGPGAQEHAARCAGSVSLTTWPRQWNSSSTRIGTATSPVPTCWSMGDSISSTDSTTSTAALRRSGNTSTLAPRHSAGIEKPGRVTAGLWLLRWGWPGLAVGVRTWLQSWHGAGHRESDTWERRSLAVHRKVTGEPRKALRTPRMCQVRTT